MATLAMFNELEYYRNYRLDKDEIDLRSFLLDQDVAARIASCDYPTPAVLSQLQRTKGQAPRDPRAKNVAPFPPRRRKEEIFSADRFADKDAYVTSLLPGPSESEQAFATRLFRKCSSNLDRARAAFYFVCTADVDGLTEFDGESSIYRAIRTMRNNVNSLCARLLRLANVPVVQINGSKKGAGYECGISTGRQGGSWMACYVDGEWRFIDAYWGSTAVEGFDAGNYAMLDDSGNVGSAVKREGQMVYSCDEYYFLTDPDKLILTHYPVEDQSQWQLLVRPLTFQEFQQMPNYFDGCRTLLETFHVTLKSHPLNVIVAPPGTIQIFLTETADEMYDYDTTISIHKSSINSETRAAIKEQSNVKGFLSKVSRMGKNEVKFKFVPPCRGKFMLQITLKQTVQEAFITYNFVSYVIHCPKADENAKELPEGSDLLPYYGAGAALNRAGMITDEPGEIEATNGERLLILESGMRNYDRSMLNCLLMGSSNEMLPTNNVLIWVIGCKIYIMFLSPDSGFFALVVQERETPVCQFLIDSPSEFRDARDFQMPDLDRLGGLGFLDEELNEFIQPDSHLDPYVKCEVETLELKFTLKVRMEIEAELLHIDSNGQDEPSDGFAFVNGSDRGFCVDVRFIIAGHFVVMLKARRERSDPWRHYGNYFVRSLGQLDGRAERFPDRLQAWDCDHRLVRPKNKLLPLNERVNFTLQTSEADVKSVYLVNEAKNERSLMRKDENGLWQGSAKGYRDSAGGEIKVVSVSNKNDSSELLGYRFETKEDQNIRNLSSQAAAELNETREQNERLRQRKQQNHERSEQAMELLPEDPMEEERERIRLEQEAEQRRLEDEKRRREKEEQRRRKEEEERKKREIEKRRLEEEMKKKEEEEARLREEEAARERERQRRAELETKQRRREAQQSRQKEAAAASRAETREEIRRSMDAAEARRKQEKRERRRAKSEQRKEKMAAVNQSVAAEKRKKKLRDQLELTLHRDPECKSIALDSVISKLKEEDVDSEDEALLLLSARNKKAVDYKRELESAINKAKKSQNPSDLRSLVSQIDSEGFSKVVMPRLEPEYSQAKNLIKTLERQASTSRRQSQQQPELNQRSLAELCGRKTVNSNLHATVQAVLLLLGHCELETKSWTRARTALKKIGGKLNSQQADRVDPGIATRAKQLLESVGSDQSGIGASLHDWALELSASVLEGHEGNCFAAVGKQQLKVLRVPPGQVDDWAWDDKSKIF